MAGPADNASMALFCDFENIALGVRDAQYDRFDIKPILERLLTKGSIVVKKAYCDWDRYKGFKATMHEANFELIEIPHVRQSGKNSADIRLVVDALDLCYTKSHVDTFVIISGDSDFSPLVSKLRENAKQVIGVGVKQSTSDLLIANCDEFIYYDDLVRDGQRDAQRRNPQERQARRTPEEEVKRREKMDGRKNKAVELVVSTFEDLIAVRGDNDRIWASVLKEVVKRRNPGFNESYYGFRMFGNLLEEAANRGLLGFGRDEKGAYVTRAPQRVQLVEPVAEAEGAVAVSAEQKMDAAVDNQNSAEMTEVVVAEATVSATQRRSREKSPRADGRRAGSRGRKPKEADAAPATVSALPDVQTAPVPEPVSIEAAPASGESAPAEGEPRRRSRGGRKPKSATVTAVVAEQSVEAAPVPLVASAEISGEATADKPKRRSRGSSGQRTPRKSRPKAE